MNPEHVSREDFERLLELSRNGIEMARYNLFLIRIILAWLAGLTIFTLFLAGAKLITMRRMNAIGEMVLSMLELVRRYVHLDAKEKAEAQQRFAEDVASKVKEKAKEGTREAIAEVGPPSSVTDLPIVPVPPSGAIIKPEVL